MFQRRWVTYDDVQSAEDKLDVFTTEPDAIILEDNMTGTIPEAGDRRLTYDAASLSTAAESFGLTGPAAAIIGGRQWIDLARALIQGAGCRMLVVADRDRVLAIRRAEGSVAFASPAIPSFRQALINHAHATEMDGASLADDVRVYASDGDVAVVATQRVRDAIQPAIVMFAGVHYSEYRMYPAIRLARGGEDHLSVVLIGEPRTANGQIGSWVSHQNTGQRRSWTTIHNMDTRRAAATVIADHRLITNDDAVRGDEHLAIEDAVNRAFVTMEYPEDFIARWRHESAPVAGRELVAAQRFRDWRSGTVGDMIDHVARAGSNTESIPQAEKLAYAAGAPLRLQSTKVWRFT